MKACQIYKTKSNYKIVTMYRLESGSYIISHPICILPLDVSHLVFANKLQEALAHSREISETEEELFWLGNTLLKELKEHTYHDFYNNSTSCIISLQEQIYLLEPHKYLGKGKGLVVDEIRVMKMEVSICNQILVQVIINLLNGEGKSIDY